MVLSDAIGDMLPEPKRNVERVLDWCNAATYHAEWVRAAWEILGPLLSVLSHRSLHLQACATRRRRGNVGVRAEEPAHPSSRAAACVGPRR